MEAYVLLIQTVIQILYTTHTINTHITFFGITQATRSTFSEKIYVILH